MIQNCRERQTMQKYSCNHNLLIYKITNKAKYEKDDVFRIWFLVILHNIEDFAPSKLQPRTF